MNTTYSRLVFKEKNEFDSDYFRFHKPFDTALFVQSIFMVFVMFVMQELCLRMDRKRGRIRSEHAFLGILKTKYTDPPY